MIINIKVLTALITVILTMIIGIKMLITIPMNIMVGLIVMPCLMTQGITLLSQLVILQLHQLQIFSVATMNTIKFPTSIMMMIDTAAVGTSLLCYSSSLE